jgi:hypothetical protein
MEQECIDVIELILDIYKDFGFDDVVIKFSDRPENRIGSDEVWDKLEGALINALDSMGREYKLFPGEGAFYGPKLEFVEPARALRYFLYRRGRRAPSSGHVTPRFIRFTGAIFRNSGGALRG